MEVGGLHSAPVIEQRSRPVTRELALLFRLASVLVLVATIQLFVLSEHTDRFFAWTIAEPLTAAVDGAFYLAAVFLLFPAADASAWDQVRPVAWGVLAVSTLKLAATLLHLGPFHLNHGALPARIAAWGWLGVYVVVPIALSALILVELHMPGGHPDERGRAPAAFRWFSGALAAILVGVGVALLLAPGATAERWPWSLTDLTAQALSAWFVGIGVVGGLAVLGSAPVRVRPVWMASVALALLQGVALARYPGAVDWGSSSAWLYVALFAWVGVAGAWGWMLSRRPAEAPVEVTARSS